MDDDEGAIIMRSPNPFTNGGADVSLPNLPRLGRDALFRYLDMEIARRAGGQSLLVDDGLAARSSSAPLPAQAPETFILQLSGALNNSVPEHSHLKMPMEQLRESPFTPRTIRLMSLARQERLHDEWRRQRAQVVKDMGDGSILLASQRPSYIDYCRCVRIMQQYSCGLPRWRGVLSPEGGDPCFVPPLFLADAPRGVGWRFHNFTISASVAAKIVLRRGTASGGTLSSLPRLRNDVCREGATGHQTRGDGGACEPCIDIVDVMHNLYPLYPIGHLKVAISDWAAQLSAETMVKCRTRLDTLPPEDTVKTAGIFHLLVAAGGSWGSGTRISRETFVGHMPRGDRGVAQQAAAFAVMFDKYCRVDVPVSMGGGAALGGRRSRFGRARSFTRAGSMTMRRSSQGSLRASSPSVCMDAGPPEVPPRDGMERSVLIHSPPSGSSPPRGEGACQEDCGDCGPGVGRRESFARSTRSDATGASMEAGGGSIPFMDLECLANALHGGGDDGAPLRATLCPML